MPCLNLKKSCAGWFLKLFYRIANASMKSISASILPKASRSGAWRRATRAGASCLPGGGKDWNCAVRLRSIARASGKKKANQANHALDRVLVVRNELFDFFHKPGHEAQLLFVGCRVLLSVLSILVLEKELAERSGHAQAAIGSTGAETGALQLLQATKQRLASTNSAAGNLRSGLQGGLGFWWKGASNHGLVRQAAGEEQEQERKAFDE